MARDKKTDKRQGKDFFQALAELPNAGEVDALFDQQVRPPLPLAAPEFWALQFRTFVDHQLARLGEKMTAGAGWREWFPLYRLGSEIDPFYFTEANIRQRLRECPPLTETRQGELAEVLTGYFLLRKEGFLPDYPAPLVSGVEAGRWGGVFPPELQWEALDILRTVGLYPVASRAGWRALHRFEEGGFSPPETRDTWHQWERRCAAAEGFHPHPRGERGDGIFRADFAASCFAEGRPSAGYKGHCGGIPRCDGCPLRRDCAWARSPAKADQGPEAVLGRVRQNRTGSLTTGQLVAALFGVEGASAAALRAGLEELPLRRLAEQSLWELEEWLAETGVAPERLRALVELCRRFDSERLTPGLPLTTAEQVFRHFRGRMRDLRQEQFLVVLLDVKRRYLEEVLVTQGTLNETLVHPREVFAAAVRQRAASVLVLHNHPSADPTPSSEDLAITRRLVESGGIVGIPLLDHIIIAGERYFSFLESGKMG